MSSRLSMQARDSRGRAVSLLNDEVTPQAVRPLSSNYPSNGPLLPTKMRAKSSSSVQSHPSSPRTPDLLRSDSYDSYTTNNDQISPSTPTSQSQFGRHNLYANTNSFKDASVQQSAHNQAFSGDYTRHHGPTSMSTVRTNFAVRSASYSESHTYKEDSHVNGSVPERGVKRYPCRFLSSHGCEKTFTTSGHASRHSKIHTAEKAVHCSYPGCQKKFTRADNMKQHLETHYKERSRSSAAQKSSGSKSPLTIPAGIKKSPSVGHSSRPPSRTGRPEAPAYDATHSAAASNSTSYDTLDMGGIQQALLSRPMAGRTVSSNGGLAALDVLAFACDSHAEQLIYPS